MYTRISKIHCISGSRKYIYFGIYTSAVLLFCFYVLISTPSILNYKLFWLFKIFTLFAIHLDILYQIYSKSYVLKKITPYNLGGTMVLHNNIYTQSRSWEFLCYTNVYSGMCMYTSTRGHNGRMYICCTWVVT